MRRQVENWERRLEKLKNRILESDRNKRAGLYTELGEITREMRSWLHIEDMQNDTSRSG